jgi:hypothetical protein
MNYLRRGGTGGGFGGNGSGGGVGLGGVGLGGDGVSGIRAFLLMKILTAAAYHKPDKLVRNRR